MDYVLLGKKIYGTASCLEKAQSAIKKLEYMHNDFIEPVVVRDLDDFEMPDELYVFCEKEVSNEDSSLKVNTYDSTIGEKTQNLCEQEKILDLGEIQGKHHYYIYFTIETKNETRSDLLKRCKEKAEMIYSIAKRLT